jgi:hypothetical protein
MVQAAENTCFLLKALQTIMVGLERLGKNLYSNHTLQARITRTIHFAHATRPNQRLNFVRTKLGARLEGHA